MLHFDAARSYTHAPGMRGCSIPPEKRRGYRLDPEWREPGRDEEFEFLTRRYSSSSPRMRQIVFGSLGLFTLAVAGGFALLGAWPVAPFAGLECVALWFAYRWLQRHDGDFESITIGADSVIVERNDGGRVMRNKLGRHWAQVMIDVGPVGDRRLLLRSHGREVEIGTLLPDAAKLSLAKQLRTRISGLV